MLHCPPFLKYLNVKKNKNKLNKFYEINDIDIIFNNGNIDKDFYNNRTNIINIVKFLNFISGSQADSGECLNNILNILYEENRIFDNFDIYKNIDSENLPKNFFNILLKNINNPIYNIFRFYFSITHNIEGVLKESIGHAFVLQLSMYLENKKKIF